MKTLSNIVPGIFMVVVAVVAAVLLYRVILPLSSTPSAPSTQQALLDYNHCLADATASGAIDQKALQKCGEHLTNASTVDDLIKGRMDEMRWMLTLIGSLAAFFVIAQGGFSFFAAQSYVRSADEAIARIKEQEDGIKARYPIFAEVEKAREEAYRHLRLDWTTIEDRGDNDPVQAKDFLKRFYRRMSVAKRQKLLSVESFASIDLDPGPSGNEHHSDDLVRLAFFYQSKFTFEDDLGKGMLADLERADEYLRIAFEKSNDFTILNDLGASSIYFHAAWGGSFSEEYLRSAVEQLKASLHMYAGQQRAHYNLGILEGKYRRNYDKAISHLRDACQQKNWERQPVKSAETFIYFTLGCYLARQLFATQKVVTIAESKEMLSVLQLAASLPRLPEKMIVDDFDGENGDIFPLFSRCDSGLQSKLMEIKESLLQGSPATPKRVLPLSIRERLKLIRSALSNKQV